MKSYLKTIIISLFILLTFSCFILGHIFTMFIYKWLINYVSTQI